MGTLYVDVLSSPRVTTARAFLGRLNNLERIYFPSIVQEIYMYIRITVAMGGQRKRLESEWRPCSPSSSTKPFRPPSSALEMERSPSFACGESGVGSELRLRSSGGANGSNSFRCVMLVEGATATCLPHSRRRGSTERPENRARRRSEGIGKHKAGVGGRTRII